MIFLFFFPSFIIIVIAIFCHFISRGPYAFKVCCRITRVDSALRNEKVTDACQKLFLCYILKGGKV